LIIDLQNIGDQPPTIPGLGENIGTKPAPITFEKIDVIGLNLENRHLGYEFQPELGLDRAAFHNPYRNL